jgi:hypothetical protein
VGNREKVSANGGGMMQNPIKHFPNPHKKTKRSEGINQEKNGRDPLGGTNFFLDLFRNVVTKFGG